MPKSSFFGGSACSTTKRGWHSGVRDSLSQLTIFHLVKPLTFTPLSFSLYCNLIHLLHCLALPAEEVASAIKLMIDMALTVGTSMCLLHSIVRILLQR
jgi:hypothetical protein